MFRPGETPPRPHRPVRRLQREPNPDGDRRCDHVEPGARGRPRQPPAATPRHQIVEGLRRQRFAGDHDRQVLLHRADH